MIDASCLWTPSLGTVLILRASLSALVSILSIISYALYECKTVKLSEASNHHREPPRGEWAGLCIPTIEIPVIPGQPGGGDSTLSIPSLP